ncbi:hypothetical protein ACFQ1E_15030 [Sphingomonas canadensis]|uniref:Lipoprotein n=1 Tax=Sphingomonas canadensis TaxID=1219257 RepID=A0ABW3HDU1_9SPHN|nr:hypothetical protein [Sphingomonas canadensis]MCW3837484.1 hypothetical protein [Sphingomonas canadensis]
MKRFVLLAAAAASLAGCNPDTPANNITVTPTPTSTPAPTPWLTQEPLCSGTITRAEWLVCDNKGLRELHRRLAAQWESGRQAASPDRMEVLENQLYALLTERDLCQDAPCVDRAYRRYLDSPPPQAKPPVAGKPKPRPKPRPRPRGHGGNWDGGPWRDGLQNCTRDIGWDQAQTLAQRCQAVTNGSRSVCSPQRSCASLENLIDKGCRTSRRPPGFCPR